MIETIAALLAVVAFLGAMGLLVLRSLAAVNPAAAQLGRRIEAVSLWLAFAVAATATAGSLWFSEVENFVPCRMCWFQRIFMYPLAIVLLVAAIRRDRAVKYTAVPLAGIGILISSYHIGLERGWFEESTSCDPLAPCSIPWFETWGWVTLAVMAFCGFLAIIVLTTFHVAPDTDPSTSGPSQES